MSFAKLTPPHRLIEQMPEDATDPQRRYERRSADLAAHMRYKQLRNKVVLKSKDDKRKKEVIKTANRTKIQKGQVSFSLRFALLCLTNFEK